MSLGSGVKNIAGVEERLGTQVRVDLVNCVNVALLVLCLTSRGFRSILAKFSGGGADYLRCFIAALSYIVLNTTTDYHIRP